MGLKIIKAIYYDPKKGALRNTDVTEELSAEIKNNSLIYEGIYNNIFPDHFKTIRKKLKIELKFNGKKYTKFYNENEKINLPEELGIIQRIKINTNNPWLVAIGSGIIFLIIGLMFF